MNIAQNHRHHRSARHDRRNFSMRLWPATSAQRRAWITCIRGELCPVDLYVGFVIFSLWIVYRESRRSAAVIWVTLMMVLGNWTAALLY
jgi:hypothetical protein